MELPWIISSPNPTTQKQPTLKNFLIFPKKCFVMFRERTYQPQILNISYIFPPKNFLNFPTPSSKKQKKTARKNFLYFSKKSSSHVLRWLLIKHWIKKIIFILGWLLIWKKPSAICKTNCEIKNFPLFLWKEVWYTYPHISPSPNLEKN